MNIVLYEDRFVSQLFPITCTRTAHDIRCAGFNLIELLALLFPEASIGSITRPEMQFFADQNAHITATEELHGETIFVNARMAPIASEVKNLIERLSKTNGIFAHNGCVVGFRRDASMIQEMPHALENMLEDANEYDGHIISFPWDILTLTENFLRYNLDLLVQSGTEIQPRVFVYGNVTIDPSAQLNTGHGRIVLLDGTHVGPLSYLEGPILLGENSVVTPHARLEGPISTGTYVKLGGEMKHCVIQSYSNKVHSGYLGHSYIGSWVNIGALAANSDLKNTYGHVRAQLANGDTVDTERQFLGCVIGDNAKISIGTMIMEGKFIGPHSQVSGTISHNIPPFVTHDDGRYKDVPFSLAQKIARRMRERRDAEPTPEDLDFIRVLHALTQQERQIFLQRDLTEGRNRWD